MKDPLHLGPTPHEVLGLADENHPNRIVDAARVRALARGVPANRAMAAADALKKPVERAWHRLLYYDEACLERLTPNPLVDAGVLSLENRAATAQAWETAFRAGFPADPAMAHSLALLHYWWALHLEAQLAGDPRGSSARLSSTLVEAWRGTIAYWAFLLETPEFWRDGANLTTEDETLLRQKLKSTVQDRLQEQAMALTQQPAGEEYRTLHTAWTAELESAHVIARYGAKTRRGTIRAGLLLLGRVGYLDKFRRMVDERSRQNPNDETVQKVRSYLSPYLAIGTLIRNNKPEEALAAISRLPRGEAASAEVNLLRAQSLHLQAHQRAEVGETLGALESWQQALAVEGLPDKLRNQITTEVAAACHARAVALQGTQPDEAIAILELGIEVVPQDPKIRATLGELLTRRGVAACNKEQEKVLAAQKKGQAALTRAVKEAIPAMETAGRDLRRAADLGSGRARENLSTVEGMIGMMRSGSIRVPESTQVDPEPDMPPRLRELLKQVNAAVEKKDWVAAIGLLRKANKLSGPASDRRVAQLLAVCLEKHAQQQIARALEQLTEAAKKQKEVREFVLGSMTRNRWGLGEHACANCRKTPSEKPGESWYTMTLEGNRVELCESCKDFIQALSGPPLAEAETARLLETAEGELAEAAGLDPANTNVAENLTQVRDFRSKLRVGSSSGKAASGPSGDSGFGFKVKWAFTALFRAAIIIGAASLVARPFTNNWSEAASFGAFVVSISLSFVLGRPAQ